MAKRRKKVKINDRKLGRIKAWGVCYLGENLIEIDPRQKSRKYLHTLIHELLHHCFPWMSESMVTRMAPKITEGVWRKNFRRIEV